QEVGERAEGPGGYGGDNGRTSIFDYTTLPRLQHWTNSGRYDGALLTAEEHELRAFTARLLTMLQHPALSQGSFYGLNWANRATPAFGSRAGEAVSGHWIYAFLRHYRKSKSTVLVVCNFSPTEAFETSVHIPANACEWAGKKPGEYCFVPLLDTTGPILKANQEQLLSSGLSITILPGKALMFEWC
ncbi:MAG: hypothetical protein IKW19_04400, partial [Akkermansia sp.]|nr:hypothetical protein [Akkermansia sp.]